jgi:quercetin dioxygenase-like cupin family protein
MGPEEGYAVRVLGDAVSFKARAADTGEAYSLFLVTTPPGLGMPPHSQMYDDEAFFVLDGEYMCMVGEQMVHLATGAYLFVPRGTVHSFTNSGDIPARMLIVISPGGIHELFFDEIGRDVLDPDAISEAGLVIGLARMVAAAPKYGIEFLPVEAIQAPVDRAHRDAEVT